MKTAPPSPARSHLRQLVGLPAGNSVLDYRDRAILKFFLCSGARLSTACRLEVSDFQQDGNEVTIRLHEKGDKRRTIGLHFQAVQAIHGLYGRDEFARSRFASAEARDAQPINQASGFVLGSIGDPHTVAARASAPDSSDTTRRIADRKSMSRSSGSPANGARLPCSAYRR